MKEHFSTIHQAIGNLEGRILCEEAFNEDYSGKISFFLQGGRWIGIENLVKSLADNWDLIVRTTTRKGLLFERISIVIEGKPKQLHGFLCNLKDLF